MKMFRVKNLDLKIKNLGYQPGFTFIELIVVMAIVAIMTLVALGYFGNSERIARLNYSTDSLISAIKEQWQLSQSGNATTVSGNATPQLLCYALKITTGKGGDDLGAVQVGTSQYDGKTDQCNQVQGWQTREVTGQTVVLANLDFNGSVSGLELYFKPPFGYVYQFIGGQQTALTSGVITIRLSSTEVAGSSSTVKMDIASGRVYRDFSNP